MATNPVYEDSIPKLIKEFADVFSAHNRLSNRIWLLAATLTLIIVGSGQVPGGETVKFLGFEFSRADFYPISGLLIICINIAYCSSHIQAYRVGVAFHKIVARFDPKGSKFITDNVSIQNAYYMLLMPNYNRIHPLFFHLTPNGQAIPYRLLKLFVDLIYISIPWIGIYSAISAAEEKNYIFYISWIVLALSLYSSIIVMCKAFSWSGFFER